MISIFLLGDSIRKYYEERLKELLGEEYAVYAPTENCKFSTLTLNSLKTWLSEVPTPQIVHWNNGLWDAARVYPEDGCFTPLEQYESNLRKILRELKKTGAKIIFATTTPTDPKKAQEHEGMNIHHNEDIKLYNEVALKVMQENDVIINDLYSIVNGKESEFIRQDDLIHPTEIGVEALAQQVASKIQVVAKTIK